MITEVLKKHQNFGLSFAYTGIYSGITRSTLWVLMPCVARLSAAVLLTMKNKRIVPFRIGWSLRPVAARYGEMNRITNLLYVSSIKSVKIAKWRTCLSAQQKSSHCLSVTDGPQFTDAPFEREIQITTRRVGTLEHTSNTIGRQWVELSCALRSDRYGKKWWKQSQMPYIWCHHEKPGKEANEPVLVQQTYIANGSALYIKNAGLHL